MLFIFDLDGTLIEGFLDKKPREGHEWVDGEMYDAVELLPNVKDRLRYIAERDDSARFAICTNQAGVAFGYQTEDEVRAKVAKVLAELEFFWGHSFSIHICFNHPEATIDLYRYDDLRRKPEPGMLIEATKSHQYADALPMQALFVGDMEVDKQAASAANIPYLDHDAFFRA
jgi:D-glycero-D-manno-heptose 1,7-bisphosphate phosphatase